VAVAVVGARQLIARRAPERLATLTLARLIVTKPHVRTLHLPRAGKGGGGIISPRRHMEEKRGRGTYVKSVSRVGRGRRVCPRPPRGAHAHRAVMARPAAAQAQAAWSAQACFRSVFRSVWTFAPDASARVDAVRGLIAVAAPTAVQGLGRPAALPLPRSKGAEASTGPQHVPCMVHGISQRLTAMPEGSTSRASAARPRAHQVRRLRPPGAGMVEASCHAAQVVMRRSAADVRGVVNCPRSSPEVNFASSAFVGEVAASQSQGGIYSNTV
jgi:hypothetical protein